MDQLRAALDRFMQALAEQLRKNPQALNRPLDRNAQMIRPRPAQHARPDGEPRPLRQSRCRAADAGTAAGDAGKPADGPAGHAERRSGHAVGAQSARRHDPPTAAVARPDLPAGAGPAAQRPARAAGRSERLQPVAAEPGRLARAIQKLLEQLRKQGLGAGPAGPGPGQNGMGQLGRAGKEMGNAEGQLGEGDADSAVGSQGRALEALRQGAQGMAQAMQQARQGPGMGRPGRYGRRARSRTPIRSAGRCAGATTATTARSRCQARSTCSAPAAFSKNCASASARTSGRNTSLNTSSGCCRGIELSRRLLRRDAYSNPPASSLTRRAAPRSDDPSSRRRGMRVKPGNDEIQVDVRPVCAVRQLPAAPLFPAVLASLAVKKRPGPFWRRPAARRAGCGNRGARRGRECCGSAARSRCRFPSPAASRAANAGAAP